MTSTAPSAEQLANLGEQARALLDQLAELVTEYPTDEEGMPAAELALTVAGQRLGAVEVTAGQAAWLAVLIGDEAQTCANAHSDQSGECSHCDGTGDAGGISHGERRITAAQHNAAVPAERDAQP